MKPETVVPAVEIRLHFIDNNCLGLWDCNCSGGNTKV
jgi:hypothetical protein